MPNLDELARKDPQITSCAGVATSESVVLQPIPAPVVEPAPTPDGG